MNIIEQMAHNLRGAKCKCCNNSGKYFGLWELNDKTAALTNTPMNKKRFVGYMLCSKCYKKREQLSVILEQNILAEMKQGVPIINTGEPPIYRN